VLKRRGWRAAPAAPRVLASIHLLFPDQSRAVFVNVPFGFITIVAASRIDRDLHRSLSIRLRMLSRRSTLHSLCDRSCAVAAHCFGVDAVCAFNRHLCRIFVMDAACSPSRSSRVTFLRNSGNRAFYFALQQLTVSGEVKKF
jgi:hypothetical protein